MFSWHLQMMPKFRLCPWLTSWLTHAHHAPWLSALADLGYQVGGLGLEPLVISDGVILLPNRSLGPGVGSKVVRGSV